MSLIVPESAKGDRKKPFCPFLTSMLVGGNELGQMEARPIEVACAEKKCRLWLEAEGTCALVRIATGGDGNA